MKMTYFSGMTNILSLKINLQRASVMIMRRRRRRRVIFTWT